MSTNGYNEYNHQTPDEDYDEEFNIEINKNIENEVLNNKMAFRRILNKMFSKKFLMIGLVAIFIAIFIGLAYFSKRFGEGETSAEASGYILDNEVDIKEKQNQGYYYVLSKDIIEKYEKALNEAYDKGEYDKEWLNTLYDITTTDIEQNESVIHTSEEKVEFNEQIFEEWFNTDDRKVWEPYLIKMFMTEIASSYPKLGDYEGEENTEDKQGTKKDENGDYAVQGKVEIQRTKIRENGTEGETIKLKYLPARELDRLIQIDDISALDYFSFDETAGYIYYASYTKYQTTTMGYNSTLGSDSIIDQENYRLRRSYIPYRNLTSNFSMPYNFLEALLQTSENPEYVMAVSNLILNETEIVLMIQDQIKVKKEVPSMENGTKVVNYEYTNSSNAYIKKAKTWCTDFEDKAELDVSTNQDKYTNTNGQEVNRTTTTYNFNVKSASDKKIISDKFLGLWKNKTGEYSQGVLYYAKGKEVSYKLPPDYTEKSNPVEQITSSEAKEDIDDLTDLLSRYKNTQTHEKLMKYFWNIYTEKNVYEVDIESMIKQFNTGKFKTMVGASVSDYTLSQKLGKSLSKVGFNSNAIAIIRAQVELFDKSEFRNSTKNVLGISEKEYGERIYNSTYTNFVNDGICFGIGKWTTSERKKGLLDYAKSKGKSINDDDIQIEYLIAELDSTGTSDASKFAKYQLEIYGDSLKNVSTLQEAATLYYTAFIKDIEDMIIWPTQTVSSTGEVKTTVITNRTEVNRITNSTEENTITNMIDVNNTTNSNTETSTIMDDNGNMGTSTTTNDNSNTETSSSIITALINCAEEIQNSDPTTTSEGYSVYETYETHGHTFERISQHDFPDVPFTDRADGGSPPTIYGRRTFNSFNMDGNKWAGT